MSVARPVAQPAAFVSRRLERRGETPGCHHFGVAIELRRIVKEAVCRSRLNIVTKNVRPNMIAHEAEAEAALTRADGRLKVAVLLLEGATSPKSAEAALATAGGSLRKALERLRP